MEQFIEGLTEKVGLDRDQAERVVDFVKEHWSEIPQWLGSSGILDRLPGGLGERLEGMLHMGSPAEETPDTTG